MKCSTHVKTPPIDLIYSRPDQPEVVELEPEDAYLQWRLAQRLAEPESAWERTMPMDLMP
jgi:hypothetical protein